MPLSTAKPRSWSAAPTTPSLPREPMWLGCVYLPGLTKPPLCWYTETQLPVLAWSSQARGFFSGRYSPGLAPRSASPPRLRLPENWQAPERTHEIARQLGCTHTQVALAWVLSTPSSPSSPHRPSYPAELRYLLGRLDVHSPPTRSPTSTSSATHSRSHLRLSVSRSAARRPAPPARSAGSVACCAGRSPAPRFRVPLLLPLHGRKPSYPWAFSVRRFSDRHVASPSKQRCPVPSNPLTGTVAVLRVFDVHVHDAIPQQLPDPFHRISRRGTCGACPR